MNELFVGALYTDVQNLRGDQGNWQMRDNEATNKESIWKNLALFKYASPSMQNMKIFDEI